MSEKTEKASAFKLKKAKEQGQVSKSIDLNTNLSLLIILGMITALWPKTIAEIQRLMRALLISSGTITLSLDASQQLFTLILNTLCSLWLPFALAATLSIILSSIAQTGLIWSSKPLVPDFKRISRAYKKVLSVKTIYDALKTLFKLSTALVVLYLLIKKHLLEVLPLQLKQPKDILVFMMHFLSNILLQILLVLTIFAIFDLLYTRWKYSKDQGMSKQELKEEHRQRDGDPK
ncbi:MAG: EscU/YscU/HrcU family type III secretion system export apparatus switch protein, partial [Legionella sp.]